MLLLSLAVSQHMVAVFITGSGKQPIYLRLHFVTESKLKEGRNIPTIEGVF
jgi:hypothetical protein